MIGKTLNARSYTTLLLVVVGVLLALNLFAQRAGTTIGTANNTDRTDLSDSSAIREVAAATREVAQSNREIARSIDNLARAVGGLDMSVTVNNSEGDSTAPSGATVSNTVQMLDEDGQATTVPVTEDSREVEPDEDYQYEGSLNIR